MKIKLEDIFEVRVNTRFLNEYLKQQKADSLTLSMVTEIADSFERFSKNVITNQAGTILNEALADWDL